MRKTLSAPATAGIALLVAMGLSACSSEGDENPLTNQTSTTEETGSPETETENTDENENNESSGVRIEGTGYSYSVPEGWVEVPEVQNPVDTAMRLDGGDELTSNLNVIYVQGDGSLEEIEQGAEGELAQYGATNVTINDRVKVDGEESVHITADIVGTASFHQYAALGNGGGYIITFTFTEDFEGDTLTFAEDVLDTWSWE